MTLSPRTHLLALWNPLYETNAMQAHLRVLLDRARRFRRGNCDDCDVYVWWGKVRSPTRLQPLPHHREVLQLDHELERGDEAPETHLYLTDYSSLYVAHVGEICEKEPRGKDEKGAVPAYYKKSDLHCDFWFKLWDIRRLVDNDLPTVLHELNKLRDTRHENRRVSAYSGMIELPLLVHEETQHRYFDDEFRKRFIGERFWVEHDSEQAGVGAIEAELREHMFGEAIWRAFGPTTRLFVATAEKLYRDHYTDPAFDFSPVIVEFCKAVEVRTNDLLWAGLGELPPSERAINRDGRSVELQPHRPFSLRELSVFIAGDKQRNALIASRFEHGAWFASQLPPILEDLARFRAPAAHSGAVERAEAMRWRNQLCGVGCHGDLLDLAKVAVRNVR